MPAFVLQLVVAAAPNAAEEGKKVIVGMLIVGLVFVGVIAVGETLHWWNGRRKARRRARRAY